MDEQLKWELIQAALDGEELDRITDRAAHYLGSPLVVISTTSNIIAHSAFLTPPDETWLHAVERGYITLEFVATLAGWDKHKDHGTRYECITVAINDRRRRFYKLTIHSQLLGYLNVTELDGHFDTVSEEEYHFVAQLIAKEVYARLKGQDFSRKARDEDFLLELLHGSFVNRGHFIDRMRLSGFDPSAQYRVLCIELGDFLSYNADEDTFKRDLLELLPGSTMMVSDQVLVILASDRLFLPERAPAMLRNLDSYLRSQKLLCGISDAIGDLYYFSTYRDQALSAARYRKYLIDQSLAYTFYDEVKVYDILQQIPRSELIHYCSRQVYEIYQYDAAQHTDYITTLLAYLKANRSVKSTAAYLHVHRNTVNYRIARIRELFGLDLDSFSTAHQILLSCQMIRLLLD